MRATMARTVRVVVLGEAAGGQPWETVLAWPSLQLARVDSLAALVGQEADFGLACLERSELMAAASAAAASNGSPLALLVGSHEREHPLFTLLASVIESKQSWESAFDAIVDPLAVLTETGAVQRANLGFASAVKRSVREVVGAPFAELVGPAVKGEDPVKESLADGQPRSRETAYRELPGLRQVTTSPLKDPDGSAAGLVVLLKDLTETKREQERMMQAARLADIGQLAAGVAHEINTPLASIALRAESLLRAAEDPRLQAIDSFKNFQRYLKTIVDEIFRCKKIISALLDFSRVRPPELRDTDLNDLTQKAADLVEHQMRLKQVQLDLRLDPELPHLRADDGQLRQAVLALLMNALDATRAGGRVSVSTERDGAAGVKLRVADDGMGIPAEVRDRIFNPFFTTKPPGQGTGLGLAVCHGVVTAHGGEIRIDSQIGHGTAVTLTLPLQARPPAIREE
jgi:signal transduction histidine kinase